MLRAHFQAPMGNGYFSVLRCFSLSFFVLSTGGLPYLPALVQANRTSFSMDVLQPLLRSRGAVEGVRWVARQYGEVYLVIFLRRENLRGALVFFFPRGTPVRPRVGADSKITSACAEFLKKKVGP